MSVTSDVTKSGDTVTGRFTVKNLPSISLDEVKKPAFAFAGLADLAIEQVKDAPAAYAAEIRKAQERLAEVPGVVKGLPATILDLRTDVEKRATKASDQVGDVYASLAKRGKSLVTRIRHQAATEQAVTEGKQAVKKVEAAVTATKKTAKASEKAVADASKKIG